MNNFTLSLSTGEFMQFSHSYREIKPAIEAHRELLKGVGYRVHAREGRASGPCTCKFCKGSKS